jgi:cytochrome c oxidase subunit 4
MTTATHSAPHEAEHHAHGHDDHSGHHVQSLTSLFTVYAILMVMTGLTVLAYTENMGIIVSMLIAAFKATLVALYFMHLRYDRPFNAILFCGSFFFVALFLGATLQDYGLYYDELEPVPAVEAVPDTPAEDMTADPQA